MPKITIRNMANRIVSVDDPGKPILYHLQQAYIDWMHACGGKGRCTTCKLHVTEGWENLAPRTPAEERYFSRGEIRADERLACQAMVKGDIVIVVPTSTKLPHLSYSDD